MRTIKVKHTPTSQGVMTMQNPVAETGCRDGVYTYELFGIPDDVSDSMAIRLLNTCAIAGGVYRLEYGSLRQGKIINCPKCDRFHLLEKCPA